MLQSFLHELFGCGRHVFNRDAKIIHPYKVWMEERLADWRGPHDFVDYVTVNIPMVFHEDCHRHGLAEEEGEGERRRSIY